VSEMLEQRCSTPVASLTGLIWRVDSRLFMASFQLVAEIRPSRTEYASDCDQSMAPAERTTSAISVIETSHQPWR
jgi:hypothetical protein